MTDKPWEVLRSVANVTLPEIFDNDHDLYDKYGGMRLMCQLLDIASNLERSTKLSTEISELLRYHTNASDAYVRMATEELLDRFNITAKH